jgi:hypothetical protein
MKFQRRPRLLHSACFPIYYSLTSDAKSDSLTIVRYSLNKHEHTSEVCNHMAQWMQNDEAEEQKKGFEAGTDKS